MQNIYRKRRISETLKFYLSCLSAPGDLDTLKALHGNRSAFTEPDRRGWLPFHRAAVQQNAEILDAVLLGERR